MSRPQKEGLSYFPLDTDFFNNKKIKALRREHGLIGVLTYINILCKIYAHGYYYKFESIEDLSYDIAEEIANEQLKKVASCVTECIHYLIGTNQIDKGYFERDVITSRAIQEQYKSSIEKSKRAIKMDEYLLIDISPISGNKSEETPVNSEETRITSEETPVNSELMPLNKIEIKNTTIKENILKESTFTKSSEIRELAKKLCPSVSRRFEDKIENGSIYALSELEDTLTALNLHNEEFEKLFKHVSKTYISEINPKWDKLDLLWVLQHVQKVNAIEEINYKKAEPVKKVDGSKYERSE
jgi:hypothetical protein